MARSVRARIETRSARLRLPGRKEPYWQKLEKGLAAGYYRPTGGGSGTWWGRVMVGGRYRQQALAMADDHVDADGISILTWTQAQAAARSWASRHAGGPYSVRQAVNDYIEDLRARKGDRAAYEASGRLGKHLIPKLGDRLLAELTTAELTGWRNGMVTLDGDEDEIRRSRDSGNRVLGMAKACFNFAFRTGRVPDDREWRKVQSFRSVDTARKVLLSEIDLQLLVDACPSGLRELVMAGAMTGCRLGELTSARVRAFDRTTGTLTVRGKTGSREVPLSMGGRTLMQRLAQGRRADEWLFTTADGRRWAQDLHRRPFQAAVERAGVDPQAVFYSLRHTWISRALIAGAPTRLVAELAGTSVAMIERHYAKFLSGDRQRYAAMAAPQLRIETDDKVVVARPGTG